MTTIVLSGYDQVAGAKCPSCGGCTFAFHDDGDKDTVVATCWCGGHGRVRRDDPDLVRHLQSRSR